MLGKLKLYFSLFFLTVFLFPAVVQDVHAINHEKAFHCDANGEQHLHTQHHDCTLCDFVLPVVSSPSNADNNFSLFYFASTIFPNQAGVYFSSSQFSSASLRAPPAIS
jgi:hypothetical protein